MKKKIALIGSKGQLGSDLLKQIYQDSTFKLFPLDHQDIEITSRESINKILDPINPDIILTTAAYHNVDQAEKNPEKAFLVNALGTKYLADYCFNKNSCLVFFSTDYVFGSNSQKISPFDESDCPAPVNTYGVSKLAGENLIRQTISNYFIIRTSGLFGAKGTSAKGENFIERMIRLGKEKKEVNVVDDQILTPTYTKNLAENLVLLLKTDQFGLYHISSKGQCSWFEFASEIFKLLKMPVKCNKVDSNFFKNTAKRPNYCVLENKNLKKIKLNKMRHWKDNLKLYLKEKNYL